MDHRSLESLFAVVAPGLEEVCARELHELGVADAVAVPGGVAFAGKLQTIYQANLWLRSASRVLVRFAEFRCRAFPDLYKQALKLPWGRFVRPGTTLSFRISCRRSRLMHTARIEETLQAATQKVLGPAATAETVANQQAIVRIFDDQVTISVDSSGDLLHRRGYRLTATKAPLRETLAAGILMLLDWQTDEPLVDPMCGTGSFVLEAAQMAARSASGLEREFAFMQWPGYRDGLWRQLCSEAKRQQQPITTPLEGADQDAGAIEAALANLANLGLEGTLCFHQRELADSPVHMGTGLVVCNPPYGRRLIPAESLEPFYRAFGQHVQRAYSGWRVALLCPESSLVRATRLQFAKVADLKNGGLEVGLYLKQGGEG